MGRIQFVGLDVHKDTIDASVVSGESAIPEVEKRIANNPALVKRLVTDLKRRGPVVAAYEAGCMGFELQRLLTSLGAECHVIAPGKMPRRPSDRVKTDRRDARTIGRLLRQGEVEPIRIPSPEEEATRDYLRAREDLKLDQARNKQRLMKFLLRHGFIYKGGSYWTLPFATWLNSLRFPYPLMTQTFEDYRLKVASGKEGLREMDQRIEQLALLPQYAQAVGRLRCFRGINYLTALALICEVGDFKRFPSAQSFMAYLGLVPCEQSSGGRRWQGGITKAGNGYLRRLLIEAAWHYRYKPGVGQKLLEKRAGQSAELVAYADKAMRRLHQKYIRIVMRGKSTKQAVTAVARELAGFIWGAMTERIG
jgi:transposase